MGKIIYLHRILDRKEIIELIEKESGEKVLEMTLKQTYAYQSILIYDVVLESGRIVEVEIWTSPIDGLEPCVIIRI
jgi:hypothetical protein